MRPFLIRNIRARDNLEIFLVSAISSLLVVRLYLYLAGYPSIGGSTFHIAHVLWGGLLMMVAVCSMLAFLGRRTMKFAALVGGAGFGVFIDELGKFITRDNNYFFRPAIGLIYAVFITLYLAFNFISRPTRLTKREYQMNAIFQFEEAVLHDMDQVEKARLEQLLKHSGQNSPVTQGLTRMLQRIDIVAAPERRPIDRWRDWLSRRYRSFWSRRHTHRIIGALFVIEALAFMAGTFATAYTNLDDIIALFKLNNSYDHRLIIGQVVSSAAAAGFAVIGAILLPRSRSQGLEYFRRAVMVNLLLTEFFLFSRIGLGALPGFTANLVLLVALRYALYQEQRTRR